MARSEFRHASFGIEFYSPDSHQPIYSYNSDKFFKAASTAKLITSGSALQLLQRLKKGSPRALFGFDQFYREPSSLFEGLAHDQLVLMFGSTSFI